ncbi:MAG: hypothetical protein M9909_04700 [Thermomicrobiales bacterium]|nr:hypothetical protein [Thermomicrobiales bacterium]
MVPSTLILSCRHKTATWVSIYHGGGFGVGFTQHAGVVIVCDGTDAAAEPIGRVLWNDPATDGCPRTGSGGAGLRPRSAASS